MGRKIYPFRQAQDAFIIAKSDSVNFVDDTSNNPKGYSLAGAIYVGGGGDVVVVTSDNTPILFKAVPTGTTLYIQSLRINSTNTTATNMVALVGLGV